jgi:hypothetical protein
MKNEKEFLIYLLDEQTTRIFDYIDLGYAKAYAEFMEKKPSECSRETRLWINFYHAEVKNLVIIKDKIKEFLEENPQKDSELEEKIK